MVSNEMLLVSLQDRFPPGSLLQFEGQLSETQIRMAASANYKDPTTALLFSIFLGGLAVDRFYNGQVGLGLLKLFTGGGAFIWAFVDIFIIRNAVKNSNLEQFRKTVALSDPAGTDEESQSG